MLSMAGITGTRCITREVSMNKPTDLFCGVDEAYAFKETYEDAEDAYDNIYDDDKDDDGEEYE